jgi:hypothetical protein
MKHQAIVMEHTPVMFSLSSIPFFLLKDLLQGLTQTIIGEIILG